MNRKKVICLKQHKNNENSIEEILQLNISRNFLKCINYTQRGLMFFGLLHAKLVWMPSVLYIPNYFLQNLVYLYLVALLLNGIDNLLAYVTALFVTSVCPLLSLRG